MISICEEEMKEGNSRRNRQVDTISNSICENLSQVPRVRRIRRQDTVNRKCHNRAVVKKGNNQNHERREIEFVRERKDREADDDTDGDGACVDGVVTHTLEDDTRAADGVDAAKVSTKALKKEKEEKRTW